MPQPSSNPLPIQFTPFRKEQFASDSGVSFINQSFAQIFNTINSLLGSGGPTLLPSGIDVQGAKVTGLAAPTHPSDAVSAGHADANYGAPAVGQQLDLGGTNTLKGLANLYLLTYVNQLLAGPGITLSPANGEGVVTIGASSGGSGIDQLTGDVTAGPGTGSQPASVVKVNGAAVPASQAYVGTNSSGQIIAASAPSSSNFVDDETVSGSGTAWTLAHTPAAGCVPILVVQLAGFGGIVLLNGQTPGFTISGANITTTSSYSAGALAAWYRF